MLSQSPDTVVTFGDSLSDSGAIFGLTGALLADPLALPVPGELLATPGYSGVFSNGPVHTQRLVAELGAGLDGYAVGGARAADDRTVADYVDGQTALIDPTLPAPQRDALLGFDLELGGQVDRFLAGDPPF